MRTLFRFFRSKAGRILIVYLILAGAISAAVASYFYTSSLQTFVDQKVDEKATVLQLVDAFVTNYSRLRSQFGENAPVPATFRAHSIESFNKQLGDERLVGPALGRASGPPHHDAARRPGDGRQVEAFATTTDRSPRSTLTTIDNRQVLRTVYPSLANEQSCVTCHNQLQPDKVQWRLNDVMGAFAIDIPVATVPAEHPGRRATRSRSPFSWRWRELAWRSRSCTFRQLNEREWSAEHVQIQNIRFNAALNNMSQGLCMFDSDKRLVVCNERYARLYSLPPELLEAGTSHEAIIKHRIASGILAGRSERGTVCGAEQAFVRQGIEPDRQAQRRPPDQGRARADAGRRMGRDPRGRDRAGASRFDRFRYHIVPRARRERARDRQRLAPMR